jgi:TolA-binding protein
MLLAVMSADLGKIARFQHEARTTSSLNHPNICTIFEIDEHDGRHFIVMEYLEGKPLSRIIDNRPIEGYRLIELAIQIADGLEAAHEARVIHRDLKPANIYVSERDHIKLLDFGLAMLMPPVGSRSSSSSATWLSEPGGTGPYMSPEQTLGEPLDTRSDLFSFGIVLYEMATGTRPFTGSTHAALVDAIRHERAFPARDMNTDVSDELDRIINKALEKNRKLRYQTASDMAADLRRLKRDLDTQAHAAPRATPSAQAAVERSTKSPSPGDEETRQNALHRAARQRWAIAQLLGAGLLGGALVAFGLPADRVPPFLGAEARPVRSPKGEGGSAKVAGGTSEGRQKPAPTDARGTDQGQVAPALPEAQGAKVASGTQGLRPAPTYVAPNSVAATSTKGVSDIGAALRSAEAMADLHLYDQAIATLQNALQTNPTSASAPAAHLLMASIQERRGRIEDALAMYLDTAVRYPTDPHAPRALFDMAGAILKSKHDAKEQQAAKVYTDIATQYRSSTWAARSLMARAELEQRRRQTQVDPLLGRPAPAALATYREIVQGYPQSSEREHALWHLASLYEDLKRYDLAVAALSELGSRYSATAYDPWFAAAEIYQKRLNDPAAARTAYAQVPPTSPHWNDAQKRLSSD